MSDEVNWKAVVERWLDDATDNHQIKGEPIGVGGQLAPKLGYHFGPDDLKPLEDLVGYWQPMTGEAFRDMFEDEPSIEVRDGEARKKPEDDWSKPKTDD